MRDGEANPRYRARVEVIGEDRLIILISDTLSITFIHIAINVNKYLLVTLFLMSNYHIHVSQGESAESVHTSHSRQGCLSVHQLSCFNTGEIKWATINNHKQFALTN